MYRREQFTNKNQRYSALVLLKQIFHYLCCSYMKVFSVILLSYVVRACVNHFIYTYCPHSVAQYKETVYSIKFYRNDSCTAHHCDYRRVSYYRSFKLASMPMSRPTMLSKSILNRNFEAKLVFADVTRLSVHTNRIR